MFVVSVVSLVSEVPAMSLVSLMSLVSVATAESHEGTPVARKRDAKDLQKECCQEKQKSSLERINEASY